MPERPGLRPLHVAPVPLADLTALLGLGDHTALPSEVVTGVTHDSRQVRDGDLYAALPGAITHGARFVDSAVTAGAAAILTDPAGARLVEDAGGAGSVPMLVVADPRARLGEVAAAVYGHPARDLLMLGVTGTNGKTTTAYLLEAGLRAAGHTTGLIGTVETRVGDDRVPSVRTTPEATDVHALLALMRERGVSACAMEVSSHALVFGRVDGIVFDVAGFTNLSQDHLDFHAGLEDYFAAKADLFTPRRSRRAVVCTGDAFGVRLATAAGVPVTTLAPAAKGSGVSDWAIRPGRPGHPGRERPMLAGADGTEVELQVPLPGAFNVVNAALAVAMLVATGVDAAVAAAGVGRCAGVPGRMETVSQGDEGQPLAVVDFAHTPDAIQNVVQALRPPGRLVVVVGAGGDRDRDKRPLMGAAAARGADLVVVTDDNPRGEDAAAIRAAVLAGATSVPEEARAEVIEVGDRRAALRAALEAANGPQDTVVVLGKGHEQGQEISGVVHPFDDRQVLGEELRRWTEQRVTR